MKPAGPGAVVAADPTRASIPRFDDRPEIRSQLLASFINSFMPPAQYLKNGRNKNMYETLPDLIGGNPLLDKATTSLCSAFLARHHRDDRLLQYSTRLYSQAMSILQRQIILGKGLGRHLLYTTVIFQVYELINCSPSGFPAWLAHVQGSNAMARQCDSRDEATLAEILFLRQLRFVILCDAVGTRKAASQPVDEFIDILAEFTSLQESIDQFLELENERSENSRRTGESLLYSCLFLEEKLHNACIDMHAKLGIPSRLPKDSLILKEFRSAIPEDFFAHLSQSTQFFQAQQSIEKVRWCKAVFMILRQLGYGIAPFLKDLVWPHYLAAQMRRSPTPSVSGQGERYQQQGVAAAEAADEYVQEGSL